MPTHESESTVGAVTVFGKLARTRGNSVFWLLALATPVVVGLTAWQAVDRSRLVDIGIAVDAGLRVESTDDRWPTVRRGDRLVGIDGHETASPGEWMSRALAHAPGDEIEIALERGSERLSATAEATRMELADRGAIGARLITALLLMLMGLLAFLARPGTQVTWLLLILAWLLGLFLLVKIAIYEDPALEQRVATYTFLGAMSAGLHLICLFPHRIAWLERDPRRAAVMYVPVLAALFVDVFSLHATLKVAGTVAGAVAAVVVTLILYLQFRAVRIGNDAQGRSQYRALIVGFVLGLVLPAVWNGLRLSLGVFSGPWSAHYNSIPLLLFVGLMAYAIVRHNTLAIDRFTASVLGYAVTIVLLGGAFAGAVLGIPLLLDVSGIGDSPALLVGVTALTFAGFAPIYRRVKGWVDRRFFREQAGAAEMADALRALVVELQRSTRDEATDAALRAASILRCDRAELWLFSADAELLTFHRGRGENVSREPIRLDGPLGQALQGGVTAGVEGLAPRALGAEAQEELWDKELAMAAPIMIRAVLGGFVGVGRKRSGLGYSLEELSFLSIVAAQLGTVLERTSVEGARLDRYHLERRLGTGGMAEVFLAWQVGPGGFERRVALKRPLPHVVEDANAVAAFLDEARLAAQLRHPNIAQVYDVGEGDRAYFMVMEYVDGPSLRQLLRTLQAKGERVPVPIAVGIGLAILDALRYAHQHEDERGRPLRLVHRDINPRNVLLNRRGEVKIVDFGIARAQFQLHVTRTGTIKGTLPYMSPEQAAGEAVDHRSDLYSTGVVIWELVTGRRAYPDGPSSAPPVSAAEAAPGIGAALDRTLSRAMLYDVERRFETAEGMAAALVDAISPREPASADRIARWLEAVCPELEPAPPPPARGPDAEPPPRTLTETVGDEPPTVVERPPADHAEG